MSASIHDPLPWLSTLFQDKDVELRSSKLVGGNEPIVTRTDDLLLFTRWPLRFQHALLSLLLGGCNHNE